MKRSTMWHLRRKSIAGLVISIAIFLALPAHAQAQVRSKDPASTERKAIERLFAAWGSRDAEKVVAAFHSDALYEDVAVGQVNQGSDDIRKWVSDAFRDVADFKLEVVGSSFYKGGGAVEWVWSGIDKGIFKTGKNFSVRGISVIEVHNGRVSSYKEYYDFATVMKQLGLLPEEKGSK